MTCTQETKEQPKVQEAVPVIEYVNMTTGSYILADFVTLPAQHRVNAPQQSLLNIPKLLEALYNDELVLNIVC